MLGKSSLINSLKRKRVATVGNTPGVTTDIQEISLDKQIKLLDCPGIVFSAGSESNSDIVLRNCVKVEQLEDPIFPVDSILKRCHKIQLLELYKIPNFDSTQEFLAHIAKKKGKLVKGGIPNYKAAAVSVLKDWNSGKIKYCSLPPEEKTQHLSASIVTNWAKEFDLDSISNQERMEIVERLSDQNDSSFINMTSSITDDSHFSRKIENAQSDKNFSKTPQNNNENDEMEDVEVNDEMDDSESYEEDDIQENNQISRLGNVPSNKKKQVGIDDEDQHNPQFNKQIKKKQKAEKKKKKKLLLAQLAAASEFGENYNFSSDFMNVRNVNNESDEVDDDDESGENDQNNQDDDYQFDV